MDAWTPFGRLSSRVVYRNPWMSVREDAFRQLDGGIGLYGVVDKDDFAIIVAEQPIEPTTAAGLGTVGSHLVEQFRYPIGRRCWEFPMGTGAAGRTGPSVELARLELREETGLTAASWRHLGHLHLAAGFCSQGFDAFHATDLTPGPPDREETEADMVHALVAEDEFLAMIDDGRIVDAATIATYALLVRAERTAPPAR